MTQSSGILEFGPSLCPEHYMITARSHLIDRIVPACEIIKLPAKEVGGGRLEFARKQTSAAAPDTGKRVLKPFRKGAGAQVLTGTVFFDFRLRNPQNWAHFLNNHLPICFMLMDQTDLTPAEVTLILPAKTPGYILRAAELFGFHAMASDDTIEGEAVTFTSEPWTGIRAVREEWVRLPSVRKALAQQGIHGTSPANPPNKVFLSRKDTRNLENEAETEAFLAARGYVKIYPEDLSALEQLQLFAHAESIVGIHGAGLAPLMYLSDAARLKQLIEIFPCGHMTDVFRVMAHQVGCKWIGVRGKIKPEHIEPAYDLDNPFMKYSLQSFEVDLASLELAFDTV